MQTQIQQVCVDDEWAAFLNEPPKPKEVLHFGGRFSVSKQKANSKVVEVEVEEEVVTESPDTPTKGEIPVFQDLYISTKTKVLYLNQEIDTRRVFWQIPIIEYWRPIEGVIKKQMKIVSNTVEEFEELNAHLEKVTHYHTQHIIKRIVNPTARKIKFKDDRKITVGISKKDIMNCRGKIKKAFMNCFAIIIRFHYEGSFREIHVKVFNTGKLEIPGILNSTILNIIREKVLLTIQPFVDTPLGYIDNLDTENVLINSNFNCGFFINREKLYTILRSKKYGIETSYDPCIYPGIKCKYYFNNELELYDKGQTGVIQYDDGNVKICELEINKKYTEVSFMIFRTGSCLIVGNCSERILMYIFEFIKRILTDEYRNIAVENETPVNKSKKTKMRKKIIQVSGDYLSTLMTA
jgi:hypothetical protein